MRRWYGWVAGCALAAGSCAAGPEAAAPRTLVDAWREAGRVLPAGAARTQYLALAAQASAQAARLHEAEATAFGALGRVAERHNADRRELYAPLAKLAGQRRELLLAYAQTRLAMRGAVTPAQWATVVQAVHR